MKKCLQSAGKRAKETERETRREAEREGERGDGPRERKSAQERVRKSQNEK